VKRFVLAFILPLLACADDTINLGSRRELFVDRFLIDQLKGAELRLHEPIREGVAVKFDNPWEGMYSGYATVIKDDSVYRMYYRGLPVAGQDGSAEAVVAYAESKDGITWTKPDLGLFEVMGTRHNNVVLTNAPYTHNFSPLRDENPGVVATAARYKALGGTQVSGLHAFQSADGIHWKGLQAQAVFTKGAFDSQNVAFWSVTEGQYLCYFRTLKTVKGKSYRWISRTTSKDFIHWTEPVEMEFGDTPPEEFYTNGTHPYYRAPHIYIALAKRFFPDKVALPEAQARKLVEDPDYRVASSDSIFMTTRGGSHYERTFLEAFIRPGPTPEDWIARDNAPALGVVAANEREMFIYRLSHYAQPSSHMARYRLRVDGFISIHAPYGGGELITKPFKFSGNQLELNFATSAAGSLRVEIQDENGAPQSGYALAECPEMIGDDVTRRITWSGRDDVSKLAGKTVRLRIAMKDADLYSLRFHE
jgi:hypothetical protein